MHHNSLIALSLAILAIAFYRRWDKGIKVFRELCLKYKSNQPMNSYFKITKICLTKEERWPARQKRYPEVSLKNVKRQKITETK